MNTSPASSPSLRILRAAIDKGMSLRDVSGIGGAARPGSGGPSEGGRKRTAEVQKAGGAAKKATLRGSRNNEEWREKRNHSVSESPNAYQSESGSRRLT